MGEKLNFGLMVKKSYLKVKSKFLPVISLFLKVGYFSRIAANYSAV